RLARGQVALWRGQANDAYWHGVFGGCYLPHLRRAVKTSLLEAERTLVEAAAASETAWTREDGDGDGRVEVYVRTRALAVTLDPVAPWAAAQGLIGAERLDCAVHDDAGTVSIVLSRAPTPDLPLAMEKRVTVRDATLAVRYRLRPAAGQRLAGRWAVQWNLALTAGHAPDRYLDLAARPTLGSSGRAADLSAVTLVDEWAAVEARPRWSPAAELGWGPVETVSLSEGGFERIYQGTALLLVWRLDVAPG